MRRRVRFAALTGFVDASAAPDGATGRIMVGDECVSGYGSGRAMSRRFATAGFAPARGGLARRLHPIVGRAKGESGGFFFQRVSPRGRRGLGPSCVADAAVRGTPSRMGRRGDAFLVVRAGHPAPDRNAVREFCHDRLARYKLPRRVVIVDTLPRNALGKVVKHELRVPPERGERATDR